MIRGTKPLSEEEEKECLRKYKETKDKRFLDKIVLANQGFIYNIAYKAYKKILSTVGKNNNIIEIDDLINTGNLGLLRAIETFDPALNTRLLTYAGHWISAFIELFTKRELHKITTSDEESKIDSNIDLRHDCSDESKTKILLDDVTKNLTDEEKIYVYSTAGALPVSLTKEDLANIMLKPSVRAIDCRKSIRKKINKKDITGVDGESK